MASVLADLDWCDDSCNSRRSTKAKKTKMKAKKKTTKKTAKKTAKKTKSDGVKILTKKEERRRVELNVRWTTYLRGTRYTKLIASTMLYVIHTSTKGGTP